MPPHRFQLGPDDMVVAAYLVTDGDEAAEAAWKREYPDWFVAGSWTPPVWRPAGAATGADREGWPSAGRAPGERPAAWERAALDFGTALDPASLSVADFLAVKAAARAGTTADQPGTVSEQASSPDPAAPGGDGKPPFDPSRDAIRPVYPIEALIGVGAAGVASGAWAAARALAAAVARQIGPGSRTAESSEPSPAASPGAGQAPSRADYERYTDGLRRDMARPTTTDPDLTNIMNDIYRENARVGSGSTAAAVRLERLTGQSFNNRRHTIKAEDSMIRLQKWLRANPTASANDRAAAENVVRDIQNALAGR